MRYREKQIVHEVGAFWVLEERPGLCKVLQTGLTHSTVLDVFSYPSDPNKARVRATEKANDRAKEVK